METIYNLPENEHSFSENIERSCRNCRQFLRVQRDDEPTQHALRGFCYLGCPGFKEKGDYRLYISCTGSHDCPGFIFDKRKAELTAYERKLALSFNTYLEQEEPRMRRQVRKIQREQMKKAQNFDQRLRWFGEFFEVRGKLAQEWRSKNYKMLGYIHDNYDLKPKEYMQMLDAFADFANHYIEAHPSHAMTEPTEPPESATNAKEGMHE
jgi:hypothetical protein